MGVLESPKYVFIIHHLLRVKILTHAYVGSIPHFLKRAAVTHELFDLIVELRQSSTSAGLAENIKREEHLHIIKIVC